VVHLAASGRRLAYARALTALSGILKGHAAFVARFGISRADRAEQELARAPCSPGRECSIGRFRRPGGRSLTEEPKVRRLCAGGNWIRTLGSARDRSWLRGFVVHLSAQKSWRSAEGTHLSVHATGPTCYRVTRDRPNEGSWEEGMRFGFFDQLPCAPGYSEPQNPGAAHLA
jgi:hypothetical protein